MHGNADFGCIHVEKLKIGEIKMLDSWLFRTPLLEVLDTRY